MSTVKRGRYGNNDKVALIVFAILLVLILIPFIMFYIYPSMTDQSRANTQLSIPRIITPVISSIDGSSHDVGIAVVVELDRKTARNVTAGEIQKYAEDAVANMDYEKIVGEDSSSYIKAELSKELMEYVGEENLKGIYLMDVQCDQVNNVEQGPSEQEQRRNNVLKSLFPNSSGN